MKTNFFGAWISMIERSNEMIVYFPVTLEINKNGWFCVHLQRWWNQVLLKYILHSSRSDSKEEQRTHLRHYPKKIRNVYSEVIRIAAFCSNTASSSWKSCSCFRFCYFQIFIQSWKFGYFAAFLWRIFKFFVLDWCLKFSVKCWLKRNK